MSRAQQERVYDKPYPDRGKFKVISVRCDGTRATRTFALEADAYQYIEALRAETQARTVAAALEAYYAAMATRAEPISVKTTRFRLGGLYEPVMSSPVGSVTEARAASLYTRYAASHAVDTHRVALGQARTCARFWVKQGWLASNPWDDVEPTGRRRRGKKQLRLDDARKLAAVCIERAETDAGALAVVTALLLGLRASEVCRVAVGDFDDHGRVLLVPTAKTAAGVRELEVPAVLQPLLAGRAKWSPTLWPYQRKWVLEQTHRLCDLAGLERITAHALRGMHATIAVRRGATAHAVAAALGHSSPAITATHYIAAGTARTILEESP